MADIITQISTAAVDLSKSELELLIKTISSLRIAGTIDELPEGINDIRMLRGKFIAALQTLSGEVQDGEPDASPRD